MKLLFALGALVLSLSAHAEESDFYYSITNGAVEITGYSGVSSNLVIPARIEKLPVTSIGEDAFGDASFIVNVSLPNSLTNIGDSAFSDCTGLTEIYLPEGMLHINDYVFWRCSKLTNITFGGEVQSIGRSAFYKCGLSSIVLPDTLETLGFNAFSFCDNLREVYIPASVSQMARDAFSYCSSLSTITVHPANESYSSKDGFLLDDTGMYLIMCPAGKQGMQTVPDGIVTIGYWSFAHCYGITNIVFPDSVMNMGMYAFKQTTNLREVQLGTCLTNIGLGAFQSSGISSIILPDSMVHVEESAFSGCSELRHVNYGNNIQKLGREAFYNCDALTTAILPNSLNFIGNKAFSDCGQLSDVIIGVNVAEIDDEAFSYCWSLGSITFGNAVTNTGERIFRTCLSLTNVVFGSSVETIEHGAFLSCQKLQRLYFLGDSPVVGLLELESLGNIEVYRTKNASGWPPVPELWHSKPTALWDPLHKAGDMDHNGLNDAWELQYFGGVGAEPTSICSNGLNTIGEAFVCGFSPVNADARFDFYMPEPGHLEWNAVSGRVYQVYCSTNLTDEFQCIDSNVIWNSGHFADTVNRAEEQCFYKLSVRLED